jgi:alkylation response protein AidB-like acyl-CoA dehydrogenase
MNFDLTDEQQMMQTAAREFATREVAPVAAALDASGEFPFATIRKAGELGFMGVEVPAEYGGAGLDTVSYVLMMEEIAAADAAHSTIISVNNSLYCGAILRFGTEQQKNTFVRPIASGLSIGAYGLTEPQSGSDAANMRTRATISPDGSHYLINGKKFVDHLRSSRRLPAAVRGHRSTKEVSWHFSVRRGLPRSRFRPRQDRAQARYSRISDL